MTKEMRSISLEPVAERYQNLERTSKIMKPFVLFLGVSGVGKSTIMRQMISDRPDQYTYISPFTTRKLRPGETDKIHVSESEYMAMLNNGEFVYDNPLYGVRYGTPKKPILDAFDLSKIPLLDFPLTDVPKLNLPNMVTPIGVYCFPPDINEWYERMAKDGRQNLSRLKKGYRELEHLSIPGYVATEINYAVVTRSNQISDLAENVHEYISTLTG